MVEESRLAEYYRYEDILRKERKRLEDQCLLVSESMSGISYVSPPHLPIPATRLAMHSACDSEMKKHAAVISEMTMQWAKFSSINHYDRAHLMNQMAQLQSLPIGMRLLKLNAMEHESQAWLLRKEQDTMAYEDDIGHAIDKYFAAKNKKVDYDRSVRFLAILDLILLVLFIFLSLCCAVVLTIRLFLLLDIMCSLRDMVHGPKKILLVILILVKHTGIE